MDISLTLNMTNLHIKFKVKQNSSTLKKEFHSIFTQNSNGYFANAQYDKFTYLTKEFTRNSSSLKKEFA